LGAVPRDANPSMTGAAPPILIPRMEDKPFYISAFGNVFRKGIKPNEINYFNLL
jgi:hypothetical protein